MKISQLFLSLFMVAAIGVVSVAQTNGEAAPKTNRFNSGVAQGTQAADASRSRQQAFEAIEKAISVLIPGGIEKGTPRQEKFKSVIESFGNGKVPDAMAALQKMSQEDPELPPAEVMMAGITFAIGESNTGTALLEESAVKHPNYPGVYMSFAQLALNTNRITDASLHVEKAAALIEAGNLSPEKRNHFLKQYFELTTGIHLRRKENQKADEALNRLQALSPNLPFYLYNKAELAFRGNQNDQALQFLAQHARATESKRLPQLTLVEWLKRVGKDDQAETLLLDTLKKNPTDAITQMVSAQMFMVKEDFPNALEALKNFEGANGGETNNSIDMKGRIAFAGGSYDRAGEHFLNLTRKKPNDASTANIYALCLVESDDPEKRKQAQEISERVASRIPNNLLALAALGYIYLKNGEQDRSRQLMGRVALSRQSTPEISFFLSHWLIENKQPDQAAQILRQVVDFKGLFLYRSAARKLLASLPGK